PPPHAAREPPSPSCRPVNRLCCRGSPRPRPHVVTHGPSGGDDYFRGAYDLTVVLIPPVSVSVMKLPGHSRKARSRLGLWTGPPLTTRLMTRPARHSTANVRSSAV